MTTVTSREFNQDAGRAKRAAAIGPVFITDRGRPAHVLLRIEDYERLVGGGASIVDLLSAEADDVVEFEPERLTDLAVRPADLR
ncbi:MAG: type II toxin-antitoxin system Phd/YefM family antitoxin [Sphingomonadaceae bacterium]|nr:type II toxin-antitoxin system Phd/YefM family antitoxin [Sphingomonadaceae bacterium]